jgi:hypothetical protein
LIHHKAEAGNILEVVPVSGQQSTGMLQCLTGEPEILNAVTMLSVSSLNLRRQSAENASGRAIDRQERLSFKTPEGCQPPLASSCIESNLCAEAQFRESHGRDKDGFAVGQRLHSAGARTPRSTSIETQVSIKKPMDSRIPLSRQLPLYRPFRLFASQVTPALSGSVR